MFDFECQLAPLVFLVTFAPSFSQYMPPHPFRQTARDRDGPLALPYILRRLWSVPFGDGEKPEGRLATLPKGAKEDSEGPLAPFGGN